MVSGFQLLANRSCSRTNSLYFIDCKFVCIAL